MEDPGDAERELGLGLEDVQVVLDADGRDVEELLGRVEDVDLGAPFPEQAHHLGEDRAQRLARRGEREDGDSHHVLRLVARARFITKSARRSLADGTEP